MLSGIPSGTTSWNFLVPRLGARPARATALPGLMSGLDIATVTDRLSPTTVAASRMSSADTSSGGRTAVPRHSNANTLDDKSQRVIGNFFRFLFSNWSQNVLKANKISAQLVFSLFCQRLKCHSKPMQCFLRQEATLKINENRQGRAEMFAGWIASHFQSSISTRIGHVDVTVAGYI